MLHFMCQFGWVRPLNPKPGDGMLDFVHGAYIYIQLTLLKKGVGADIHIQLTLLRKWVSLIMQVGLVQSVERP